MHMSDKKRIVFEWLDQWRSHLEIQGTIREMWDNISTSTISKYRKERELTKQLSEAEKESENAEIEENRKKELETDISEEKWSWTVTASNLTKQIKTLDDVIEACEIDVDTWDIVSWKAKAYNWYSKNNDGKLETIQLYSVTASMRIKEDFSQHQIEEETIKQIREVNKPYKIEVVTSNDWTKRLEVWLYDTHINKMAMEELSWFDWTPDIAYQYYTEMIDKMIVRGLKEWCTSVLFTVGNDFFHIDTLNFTTTKWTRVDTTLPLYPAFALGKRIIIESINKFMKNIWPVEVVVVQGNHDEKASWFLWETIKERYYDEPYVTVDNSMRVRKYHRFGNSLILLAHGDRQKVADVPITMAQDQPKLWWECYFKEAHFGHKHHKITYDQKDIKWVIIRFLTTLTPPDYWHDQQWFIGSVRWASAFVWHADHWLESEFTFNLIDNYGTRKNK